MLVWRCASAFLHGKQLAGGAVQDFHRRLNAGEFEEIYHQADEGFRAGQSREDLIEFLRIVHTKMGDAGPASQNNVRVDANTRGTFVTTWYSTQFSNGTAIEKFTWIKQHENLKLYGYRIGAGALLR
jgi:hypothetical protein